MLENYDVLGRLRRALRWWHTGCEAAAHHRQGGSGPLWRCRERGGAAALRRSIADSSIRSVPSPLDRLLVPLFEVCPTAFRACRKARRRPGTALPGRCGQKTRRPRAAQSSTAHEVSQVSRGLRWSRLQCSAGVYASITKLINPLVTSRRPSSSTPSRALGRGRASLGGMMPQRSWCGCLCGSCSWWAIPTARPTTARPTSLFRVELVGGCGPRRARAYGCTHSPPLSPVCLANT